MDCRKAVHFVVRNVIMKKFLSIQNRLYVIYDKPIFVSGGVPQIFCGTNYEKKDGGIDITINTGYIN